jgi:hypothetical protein
MVDAFNRGPRSRNCTSLQLRDRGPRLKASTIGIRSCWGVFLRSRQRRASRRTASGRSIHTVAWTGESLRFRVIWEWDPRLTAKYDRCTTVKLTVARPRAAIESVNHRDSVLLGRLRRTASGRSIHTVAWTGESLRFRVIWEWDPRLTSTLPASQENGQIPSQNTIDAQQSSLQLRDRGPRLKASTIGIRSYCRLDG